MSGTKQDKEPVEVTGDVASADAPADNKGWLDVVMPYVWGTGALASMGIMLAVYHFAFAPKEAAFAVVDLAAAVKVREAEFAQLLSGPNVGDRERQQAFHLVQNIGPEIEKAIQRLQKECECVIVVKSAVVAGPATDLTPRLLAHLGIKGAR